MKLFGEKVLKTFTNSTYNIIQVEDFSEIFFDVYEIELNKVKCPVEKVAEYRGNPVVSVPIVIEGTEYMYPFVLMKGKQEVIFNERNSELPIDDTPIEIISEDLEEEHIQESKQDILNQIETAKKNAIKQASRVKTRKIQEATNDINEKKKSLSRILEKARATLVDEFVTISQNIRNELVDANDERFDEVKDTIDNKINDLSHTLSEGLKKDFNSSSKQFDKNVRKLITELYSSLIVPKVDKELHNIAKDIVEKVSVIDKSLNDKLDTKLDSSLLEGLNSEMSSIRDANIELNANINRGVNKALSRVGNVNTKVDELTIALSEEVDNKITQVEENINNYYTEKLKMLEEKTFDITEETRKYIVDLVQESKDNLIQEIRKTKNEKPIEYIIESKNGTPQIINEDKLVKDFDKKINTKIDNEVTRLRKYIAVYSGGGSVAVQFADGGVMNGNLQINKNLTVFGSISASQYLGITGGGGTADALPLSGGTLTGGLTGTTAVFQTISAANYQGLPQTTPARTVLTGNGTLSSFSIIGADTLTNPSALIVGIDGALQVPNTDYNVSNGVITFTTPLESGTTAVVIAPNNIFNYSSLPSFGSVVTHDATEFVTPGTTLSHYGIADGAKAIEVKSSPFAAVVGGQYVITGITVLITNPTVNSSGGALAAGDSYILWASAGGSAIVATTLKLCLTSRFPYRVVYNGSSWEVDNPYLSDALSFSTAASKGTVTALCSVVDDALITVNLTDADSGTIKNCTSANAVTINVPNNLAVGFNCLVIQTGTGQITFAGTGLNSYGGALKTAGQHASATIVRTAAGLYNIGGNLTT